MIKTEIFKTKKRTLIYTTTDDSENFQIQDEEGNVYDEAYDINLKNYLEIERVNKDEIQERETDEG